LELAAQLEALHDLPEGTLGYAFVEFHTRNGLTMPGADTHTPAHYVSHDMNHVIAGYEPTGPGEIALGAFTLAMNDTDANWMQFIANLAIHEAGIIQHGAIMPKTSTLTRVGATDLLGEALYRGSQCTSDFSQADHLAMADWSLDDVRAHFGVPALATAPASRPAPRRTCLGAAELEGRGVRQLPRLRLVVGAITSQAGIVRPPHRI